MPDPVLNRYGAFDGPYEQTVVDEWEARRDELVEKRGDLSDLLYETNLGKDTAMSSSDLALYNARGFEWQRLDQQVKELDRDIETYKLKDAKTLEVTNMSDDMVLFRQYLSSTEDPALLLQSDDFANNRYNNEASADQADQIFGKGQVPKGFAAGQSFVFRTPDYVDQRSAVYRNAVKQLQQAGALEKLGLDVTSTRSDNASGQEAVLEQIVPSIIERLANYGDLQKFCHFFQTRTGGDFIMPQHDGSDHKGETLASQGVDVAKLQQDNIGKIVLKMNTVSSKLVSITQEMLQDAVFNSALWAEMALVRRIGRHVNEVATRGLANTDWEGLTEKLLPGVTTATADGVGYGELVDLIFAVNRAYRLGMEEGRGGFRDLVSTGGGETMGLRGFLFHDSFLKLLMKMVDGDSRPLWLPDTRNGEPGRILGYPYGVNDDLQAVAASAVPCVFGNFDHFGIRQAAEVQVYRFWDSYTAVANEVRFIAFCRKTSKHFGPLDANGNNEALAKLTMHA